MTTVVTMGKGSGGSFVVTVQEGLTITESVVLKSPTLEEARKEAVSVFARRGYKPLSSWHPMEQMAFTFGTFESMKSYALKKSDAANT